MKNVFKRTLLLVSGCCFLAFTLVFGFLVIYYLAHGAGSQFFPFGVSAGSVLVGLVHVTGFLVASGICFVIGAVLCACGILPESQEDRQTKLPQ